MPCVDGQPREFAMQDDLANWTKATFPGSRVLEYRIGTHFLHSIAPLCADFSMPVVLMVKYWKWTGDAVPYDKLVHDKMIADPVSHGPNPHEKGVQTPRTSADILRTF